jgi:type 1 glutamine amidotransferase
MQRRAFGQAAVGGAVAVLGAKVPAVAQVARKKRVMVLSEAAGFRHSSIPVAALTVEVLGRETGAWDVVGRAATKEEVAATITAQKLRGVDLVFFANTTGTLGFTPEGHAAFYEWIDNGGAYAGVHSASDTFHGDAAYLRLVGGEFQTHGPQVRVTLHNQDAAHPACASLPASFEVFDEIYEFKGWDRTRVHALLSMKKHPQRNEAGDFPVAWTKRYGKGRMFYTSLGHREDMYENPLYLQHLRGGLTWALGLAPGDDRVNNPLV